MAAPQQQIGNTTASRIKALLFHVEAHHGRAQADALLLSTTLDRDYLDDETRPISHQLWAKGLEIFASRWGRAELDRIVPSLVHPENLGVWSRVLRGADTPEDAYRQLEQLGGEDAPTDRWKTVSSSPTTWVGQVVVRADEPLETDGLCARARASELSSIPILFGLPRARVTVETLPGQRADLLEQRFVVRWGRSPAAAYLLRTTLGTCLGLGGAIVLDSRPLVTLFSAAVGALLGSAAAAIGELLRRSRTQAAAQRIRLQALERSLALRERRDRSSSGFFEGSVIAGQYRLTLKLGAGASGTIWEAVRLSDGQTVALKLLRTAVAHDTVAADRLRREAAALGLAWHPNVVEVYEDGHLADGTSYLVMERLFGESLAERLQRVGTLTPEELLPVALQVCAALGAVHAAGIVHRDLKPSNIFLSRIDDASPGEAVERIKLLDFGIARVEWAETRLTNAGAPLGTPGYMSPEQEQGLEIDARSDLFALGSILFECLTGRPPPLTSMEFRSAPDDPKSESAIHVAFREMPDDWRHLIEKATDPLPRNRYMDSRAVAEALHDLAERNHIHPSMPRTLVG